MPQMSVVTAPSSFAPPSCSKTADSEQRVVERCRAQADERVLVGALEARLIGVRHPERQQAQDAAGLLESRQRLPLPLEHGQQRRVERIGRGERVPRWSTGNQFGIWLAMLQDPVGVLGRGLASRRPAGRPTRTDAAG